MTPVAPPPPDPTLVAETVKTKLPFRVKLATVAPLAGDASNRRYFRLILAGGPPHSLVLMQLASPEAFKQSEEAVSGATPPVLELPYVNILSHLAKADVPVPALYYYDQPVGLLYLEDVGDVGAAPRVHPSGLPQPQSHGAGRESARPRLPRRPDGPLHLRPRVPAAGLLSVARPGPDRRTGHPLPGGTGQGERTARPRDVPATLRPDQHPAQPQGSRTVRLYRPGEAQRSLPPAHPTDPGLREAKFRTVPRPPLAAQASRQACSGITVKHYPSPPPSPSRGEGKILPRPRLRGRGVGEGAS